MHSDAFGYFRMDGPDGHRELIESGAFTQQLHTTIAGASLSDRATELESSTFSTGTRCVRVMVLICFDPPWLQLLCLALAPVAVPGQSAILVGKRLADDGCIESLSVAVSERGAWMWKLCLQ